MGVIAPSWVTPVEGQQVEAAGEHQDAQREQRHDETSPAQPLGTERHGRGGQGVGEVKRAPDCNLEASPAPAGRVNRGLRKPRRPPRKIRAPPPPRYCRGSCARRLPLAVPRQAERAQLLVQVRALDAERVAVREMFQSNSASGSE